MNTSKNSVALALAAGGLACLALWFGGRAQGRKFVDEAPRDRFSKQRALLGANALSSVLLVGVLLVGVNYIASRRHKTFDLTQGRANSLAPQTLSALQKLPSPVKMTFYYLENRPNPSVQALLQNYERASDKVKIEFVQANSNPIGAPESLRTNGQPVLVVQREANNRGVKQEVSVVDEQNVTSALLKQNSGATRLAWLSGHGELRLEQLAGLKSALESQNYIVTPTSLLARNARVPTDAAALIVAAPTADLSEGEARTLENYLEGKGRLMMLLTPVRAGVKTPRLDALLRSLGVQKTAGLIVDEQSGHFYNSPQVPVGVRGDGTAHPILRGTSADVLFPGAVALQSAPTSPNLRVTPIFQTSTAARAVNAQTGQSVPARAPFALALAVERKAARALILSSATLATDQALALFGNQSFLLAGVGWTAGQEALVSIPPKAPVSNTLDMPTPIRAFASFFSLLILPFVCLVAGAVTWWRRR